MESKIKIVNAKMGIFLREKPKIPTISSSEIQNITNLLKPTYRVSLASKNYDTESSLRSNPTMPNKKSVPTLSYV